MTWEQTIEFIRKIPAYSELVEKAYLDADLTLNVERFRTSEEYIETKGILKKYAPLSNTILDIGSGNGISAISFALDGFEVTVSEPDPSNTIGAGAIRMLQEYYQIKSLVVYEEVAEKLNLGNQKFDIIYARQAMHHAADLPAFVKNLSSFLKRGGILFTVRDHVIYNDEDKDWFLKTHPLQQYYGGENAFSEMEYKSAIQQSGLQILKILKHYDSVINYFPLSTSDFENNLRLKEDQIKSHLNKKIGPISNIPFVLAMYKKKIGFSPASFYNEQSIPGRMYSFIAQKK